MKIKVDFSRSRNCCRFAEFQRKTGVLANFSDSPHDRGQFGPKGSHPGDDDPAGCGGKNFSFFFLSRYLYFYGRICSLLRVKLCDVLRESPTSDGAGGAQARGGGTWDARFGGLGSAQNREKGAMVAADVVLIIFLST